MEEIDEHFFATQGYQFIQIIAKGGYGIVYKVHSLQYNQDFALKRIPADRFRESEIDIMQKVESVHIVNLYKYYYFGPFVYMLMEFCPQTLKQALTLCPNSDRYTHILRLTYGVLQAIKVCHDHHIAHSDIKPNNFLIDYYGRVKVCDFGLSMVFEDNMKSSIFKGSHIFMAPEIFNCLPYNPFQADIWSLGVTFYYFATMQYPFEGNNLKDLTFAIKNLEFNAELIEENDYRNLVVKCLNKDPNQRPTIDQLINLPLFNQFRDQTSEQSFFVYHKTGQSHSSSIFKANTLLIGSKNKLLKPKMIAPSPSNLSNNFIQKRRPPTLVSSLRKL